MDFKSFERRLTVLNGPFRVVIDAPIGLINPRDGNCSGDRDCDRAARRLILSGGVFPPPRQDQFERYLRGDDPFWRHRKGDAGLSKQTGNILPYIHAASDLFHAFEGMVLESHPEACWPFLGAHGDWASKKIDGGFAARACLIREYLGIDLGEELVRQGAHPRGSSSGSLRKKGRDDWVDAAVLAIVAQVWARSGDSLQVLYDPPTREGEVHTRALRDVTGWSSSGRVIALPAEKHLEIRV